MKKVIIAVVAIASLLSFNFASGREIASVTDIFQPVWEAISSLTARVTILESTSQVKPLVLYDANNQQLGQLLNISKYQTDDGKWATRYTTYFPAAAIYTSFTAKPTIVDDHLHGSFYLDAEQWGGIYFDGPDCTGTPYNLGGLGFQPNGLVTVGNYKFFKINGSDHSEHVIRSSYPALYAACNNFSSPETHQAWAMEEISLPFDGNNLLYPPIIK